jgi:hypothetical protein
MPSLSFVGRNIFLSVINNFLFIDSLRTPFSLRVLSQVLFQYSVTLIWLSYAESTGSEAPLVWRQLATESPAET